MAQLIRSTILAARHQELLQFMDCFGKAQDVYLSLVSGPARTDKIASTIAAMTFTERVIEAYAVTNSIDLTQSLAAGTAAITAALALERG